MATIGALAVTQVKGWTFAAGGFGLGLLGMALVAGAGFLDQKLLYPLILGRGKNQARDLLPLLGIPTTTRDPGTPRIWAIGRQVRVPLHVMWQSEKEREETIGGGKGGVPQTIKRVFADVGLSLNDRPIVGVSLYIANGNLIWWNSRNLTKITTSELVSSIVSGRLVLTMATAYEEDFGDYFEVGDVLTLNAFSSVPFQSHAGTGTNLGISHWKVYAVSNHAATPSSVTLEPYTGQNVAGITSVSAGTQLFPGTIARVDDQFMALQSELTVSNYYGRQIVTNPAGTATSQFLLGCTSSYTLFSGIYGWSGTVNITADKRRQLLKFLSITNYSNESVTLENWETQATLGGPWTMNNTITGCFIRRERTYNNYEVAIDSGAVYLVLPTTYFGLRPGSGTLAGRIRFPGLGAFYPAGLFEADPILTQQTESEYEPRSFRADYRGTVESSLISESETPGTIPGYRGLAYQLFQGWDLSRYFGNQIPPLIEAVISPDLGMLLGQAIQEMCAKADIPRADIDTSDVNPVDFQGYWTQGAIPVATALQPVMIAYQVLAQERAGKLAFMSLENCDVVPIENGATFSDLGVRSGAGTPNTGDKIRIIQADWNDLPSTMGIRHQDPDAQHAVGYQYFAQRQPNPNFQRNEQDIDLSMLVMTRKKAKNLAATLMRRTWVNSTGVEMQLPVAYLELLENDIITLTDDNGNDITARILRREIGANFVVNVAAVLEDVSLAVAGSPIQTGSLPLPPVVTAGIPLGRVLDMPALRDEDAQVPGYYVASAQPAGSPWQGASVFESRDSGITWRRVAVLDDECGMGTLLGTLPTTANVAEPAFGGTPVWDTTNSLTIQLDRNGVLGPLVTVTQAEVLGGINWIAIRDGVNVEVLGFRDVTNNADGTTTLSYLLRGLRGTYRTAQTHTFAAGSEISLLFLARDAGQIKFVPLNVGNGSLPVSVDVRLVPPGLAVTDARLVSTTVSVTGRNALPFPVRDTGSDRGGSPNYDFTFTLIPWTRLQHPVGYVGPYSVDEPAITMEVRIYNPAGTTLLRTKTITLPAGSSPQGLDLPYPYAEQVADGYTPGVATTFKAALVQVGNHGDGPTWIRDFP
jgi:hypothetical protein